jgi:hypothetical protein
MNSRNSAASILMACVLAVSFLGIAPVADAVSAGLPLLKAGASPRTNVIEIRGRGRSARFYVPIAPSYSGYDYPYYYSRGHYPTHIGQGYVYYGYPYSYYIRNYNARYGGRCSRKCVVTAGYNRASARLQRRACRCL